MNAIDRRNRPPSRALLAVPALLLAAVACGSAPSTTERDETAQDSSPDPALVAAGESLFYECSACHTLGPNEFHSMGPNLYGIFGSVAGTRPQYLYSDALRDADFVWTVETMDAWLEKPSEYLPGNMMAYIGMADDEKRRALVAYLQAATSGE